MSHSYKKFVSERTIVKTAKRAAASSLRQCVSTKFRHRNDRRILENEVSLIREDLVEDPWDFDPADWI